MSDVPHRCMPFASKKESKRGRFYMWEEPKMKMVGVWTMQKNAEAGGEGIEGSNRFLEGKMMCICISSMFHRCFSVFLLTATHLRNDLRGCAASWALHCLRALSFFRRLHIRRFGSLTRSRLVCVSLRLYSVRCLCVVCL